MELNRQTLDRLLTLAVDDLRAAGGQQQRRLRIEAYEAKYGELFAKELRKRWDRRMKC